jgi:hypothetical protein
MNTAPLSLFALVLSAAASLHASEPTPITAKPVVCVAESYTYIPGCCIRTMKPVTASVAANHGNRIFLKTADGSRLSLGGIGVSRAIARFLGSLKEGESYLFPQALIDFEKASWAPTDVEAPPTEDIVILVHLRQPDAPAFPAAPAGSRP